MNVLTVVKSDQEPELSPELAAMFEEHAGEGVSHDAQDRVTPYISILQPLSPQVLKNNEKYIAGAEAGDILHGPTSRIWKGSAGIDFQPVAPQRFYTEWKPREQGGGFIDHHSAWPLGGKETRSPKDNNRRLYMMPNGNEVIETVYLSGYILNPHDSLALADPADDLEAILTFKSTGLKLFREWNDYMKKQRTPSGAEAAIRTRHYQLTTVSTTNNKGTWYQFVIQDLGWQNDTQRWLISSKLFDDIAEGKRSIGAPPLQIADHSEEVPF